ncbi:hypothetical protein P167DRAFT_564667 [Morchella conica CCBAS932]|uniref:DUF4484 domain-containing protein n=1 Tax=Morchella conica CCBAS932 TaxID=1392247 RepID=A0A3N4KXT7_9PEZI|nr:hypothetical protein P167DRAFT_564667 [Morchella conica CCBAS932]
MRGSTAPGLHMDLLTPELPPIAALFVIQFDLKAGYTITWKRTTPNITLDGVEFKSLPSGLHNLDHDLIYFVHPPHAGISAFIRVPAPSSDRNALQLSIGALVPLSYGRLGRSWRHAANLQSLARSFAADPKAHGVLDEYFHTHSIPSVDSGGENLRYRGGGDRRKGSESGLAKELEPFHPARSLRGFISLLGPLTEAKTHGSWVACTTDEILHMKTALYDLIITLPPSHNAAAWPKLETSAGAPVLATQRDLVRYRGLKRWLGGGSEDDEDSGRREESVCEPLSWREIAYTGFLWWASAGEKRGEGDGDEGRRPLLGEEESESESDGDGDGDRDGGEEEGAPQKKEAGGCLEAEVVGYFQGVTDALLAGIAEVVEDAEEGEVVVFGCEEVERLGLDKGETDAAFVKAVCERYFGREARVEVEGWSCLGGLC